MTNSQTALIVVYLLMVLLVFITSSKLLISFFVHVKSLVCIFEFTCLPPANYINKPAC